MKQVSTNIELQCYHCGQECSHGEHLFDNKHFCCKGCQSVYELLNEQQLCNYYLLNDTPGQTTDSSIKSQYDFLDEPQIVDGLLSFKSTNFNKVLLHIPQAHCSSCIWLLSNLQRISPFIISSSFNFTAKQLTVSYDPQNIDLKTLVIYLVNIGYAPQISGQFQKEGTKTNKNQFYNQLAVAAFCASNIMLFSFPEYLGLSQTDLYNRGLTAYFRWWSAILSLPVLFFSAASYLEGSYYSLKNIIQGKNHEVSVDIPIALGIVALFIKSWYEFLVENHAGYFDSLATLVLFLLTAKWLYQKAQKGLSFEQRYQSYFPLAVTCLQNNEWKYKEINHLKINDIIKIYNDNIVPADSTLVSDYTLLDYSFVSGESAAIPTFKNDKIYAGAKVVGSAIEAKVLNKVNSSDLVQLWNNNAFTTHKDSEHTLTAQRFSKYFTLLTIALSAIVFGYWQIYDPTKAWHAALCVLMVACPCALTLALPYTFSLVMYFLAKTHFFVKNQSVIEKITELDSIVFDKTGTLNKPASLQYLGKELTDYQKKLISATARQSLHPVSKAIVSLFENFTSINLIPTEFKEVTGNGTEAWFGTDRVRIGNGVWLGQNIDQIHWHTGVEFNGKILGGFNTVSENRAGILHMLEGLALKFKLHLLSGDNLTEQAYWKKYFVTTSFEQKPEDKLNKINDWKEEHKLVMMVGDGLNDAGALAAADIGVAVAEHNNSFNPACDIIVKADTLYKLHTIIQFVKSSYTMVKLSFLLSLVYNFIGIYMAASGRLSPVFAAIFMPISSISVMLFAVLSTHFLAKFKYGSLWK